MHSRCSTGEEKEPESSPLEVGVLNSCFLPSSEKKGRDAHVLCSCKLRLKSHPGLPQDSAGQRRTAEKAPGLEPLQKRGTYCVLPSGQGLWNPSAVLRRPALAGASHFPIAAPGTKHLHLYALNLIYGGNYILACQLSSHKTKFIGITCS